MQEKTIKAVKGFTKDMKCRDFQYKEGGKYEESDAIICEKGFHSCELPHDGYADGVENTCEEAIEIVKKGGIE